MSAVASLRRAVWLCAALIGTVASASEPLLPPEESLYRLDVDLTTQDGEPAELGLHRGRPTLVTMFYASCDHACPLLIATLQSLEQSLPRERVADLRVLMVSIDPARDSAEVLAALAARHGIDTTRWTLARASNTDVRRLAAVLGVRYRALPDGEFNHSTVIALLDADGRTVATSSAVGRVDAALRAALEAALAGPRP